MRDAATVLEIIRERGKRGLPLERVYRCLFNRDLYLLAYGKIYRNAGAMAPGVTRETVDGMNLGKIELIIGALRQERCCKPLTSAFSPRGCPEPRLAVEPRSANYAVQPNRWRCTTYALS